MGNRNATALVDVFVSYNSLDRDAVLFIARALKDRGLTAFIDCQDLIAGKPWTEVLEQRIHECRSATIVLGPGGIGAWQHRELYLALDRQVRDGDFRVIPLLLPGAEPALGFLALNTWIDLSDGVDDTRALDLLAAAVRGQSPAALTQESDRKTSLVCPYRGLDVFREEDAPFFFGREAFTQRLLRQVSTHNFIAVVGASGSGKSSVVRAGLVPILRRGTESTVWDILALTPGTEPLAALARTLDPPAEAGLIAARAQVNAASAQLRTGEVNLQQLVCDHLAQQPGTDRLLLVVDQFEELTTVVENAVDATRFVDLLLDATCQDSALTVLITLRSDFYTQIVQRRDLNDRLQDAVVHIGPLSTRALPGELSELEQIIRLPAKAVSLGFEDGLVARMVTDVGGEPGNLPLLEYLLAELWRQHRHSVLSHAAYDALGGVQGAIARRAEEAYAQLAPGHQQAARRLWLSLIRPGEERGDTRVAAPFPDDEQEAEVVRLFAGPGVRLLVAGEDTLRGRVIQMSHEALIRSWSRLRHWVDQNRDTLRTRERVRERLHRWREQNGSRDLLLPSGLELEEGRRLLDSDPCVATDEVREYVEASISADDRNRRRKRLWAGFSIAVSLILFTLIGWQWQEAEKARDQADRNAGQAEQERDLAIARQLVTTAISVWEENPGESALAAMLAVESQARRNTPEANALLRDVLSMTPPEMPLVDQTWVSTRIQISADGRVQVFENSDFKYTMGAKSAASSSVNLLDSTDFSPRSTRRFAGEMRPLISSDGRWLVSAGHGRRLVITDLISRREVLDETTRSAAFPVFASTGNALYVARQTGVIDIRLPPTWKVAGELHFPVAGARTVDLQLGISADDGRLFVIDPERGAFIVPTDGSSVTQLPIEVDELQPWPIRNGVDSGLVSPVGHYGLTRQAHGETQLWNLDTEQRQFDIRIPARTGVSSFSPDGKMIATANSVGQLFLHAVDDGTLLREWQHSDSRNADELSITRLAFLDDSEALISADDKGAIIVWSVADGSQRQRFELGASVTALAIDAVDGNLLAGAEDGTLVRLDPDDGTVLASQQFAGVVTRIETASHGRTVAVGVRDSTPVSFWRDIRFIARDSGREISQMSFNGELRSPQISQDGSRYAAYDQMHEKVLVWDTENTETPLEVPTQTSPVAFSPDSRRLLLHDATGPLQIVDALSGHSLFELGEPGGINQIFGKAHTNAGITRGSDRSLRGWNLATGESRWHTTPKHPENGLTPSQNGEHFGHYSKADGAIHVFQSNNERSVGSVQMANPSDGFTLSDDGLRVLTVRKVEDTANQSSESYDIEIWDVPMATSIRRWRIRSRRGLVRVRPVSGNLVALQGGSSQDQEPTSWLQMIDWADGRTLWSLSGPDPTGLNILHVDQVNDRILIEGTVSPNDQPMNQMRSLSSAELIWQQPSRRSRTSSAIPGKDLIAFAVVPGADRYSDEIRLLSRTSGRERRRMDVGGYARHIAATTDGSHLLVAVEGERWRGVRIWSVNDGKLVNQIELDANPRSILTLSDPDHFAVDDYSGNLRTFNLHDGTQRHRFAHHRVASEVVIARDVDRAVTVVGASLRFWNTRNGELIAHHIAHGDASSVVLSPDGLTVAYLTRRPRTGATGDEVQAVVIWAPDTRTEPVVLPVENTSTIQFDPTGRFLTLLYSQPNPGNRVHVINVSTLRTQLNVSALKSGSINQVEWTSDGRYMLVREGGQYGATPSVRRYSLRAFDMQTLREILRVDMGNRMVPVPGTTQLLFQDTQLRWRRFDLARSSLQRVVAESTPDRIVAAPGQSRVLTTGYWQPTLIHDLDDGQTLVVVNGDEPFNVLHAAWDPGGRFVALSLREKEWHEDSPGQILIVDARNGAEMARLHTQRHFWNVEFVDDGNALILSELRGHLADEPDHQLLHWNWRSGAEKILSRDNPVGYLAVSRDGSRFASAEGNRHPDDEVSGLVGTLQLRIWDGKSGDELVRIPLDFDPGNIALSPDASHVAVADFNEVLLFNAENGQRVAHFSVHATDKSSEMDFRLETHERLLSTQNSLKFAGQGRYLMMGTTSGVLLFDVFDQSIRKLTRIESVKQYAMSHGGTHIAAYGTRFLNVWHVDSGELLIRTEVPDIKGLSFVGNRSLDLLVVRDDRIERLYWQPDELKSIACATLGHGDWRRGRMRVIQQAGRHPCESTLSDEL